MSDVFAKKFAATSGINLLMDDLASGMRDGAIMLGGGNPGFVPQVLDKLTQLMHQATPATVKSLWGEYSEPAGDLVFRKAIANLLNRQYQWSLSEKNIVLSNGSQAAFFSLFNLLAGEKKSIVLPCSPEYIGYSQLGLTDTTLRSYASNIQLSGDQEFIYTPDFSSLDLDNAAAVCISRPCNPSGKVHTSEELKHFQQICKDANVPFIIDNAYGSPFPGIVFNDTSLVWDDNTILAFSLSKLGLPAARTGILVANEDITTRFARINAVIALSPNATAARLLTPLVESDELLELCQNAILPFYQTRAVQAHESLKNKLKGLPCRLHSLDGGIFLWLWMADFPITSHQLYEKCKQQGVVIVPGEYFFSSMVSPMENHQCIRISYAGDPETVEKGLSIIAEQITAIYETA